MEKKTFIQLKKVSVHYGGVRALEEVDISVYDGEILALIGPNGSGKSTILKTIFGIAPIYSGEIYLEGQKIKPAPHEVVRRGLIFVPQGRRIFNQLSVEENLEIGGFTIKDKKLLQERIQEAIEFFPILQNKRKTKAGTLSGGQQQILALARCIIVKPKLLLLDEPSLGLAQKIVKSVFENLKEINKQLKTTIIIVEHSIKTLLNVADRGYVLDKGKIVAEDNSLKLLESEIIKKVYLGESWRVQVNKKRS